MFDTNVLLSALAFGGETARVWELAEEGRFELFISAFILGELRRNLIAKAGTTETAADVLIEQVRSYARELQPSVRVSVITRKDADNRILELALEARAHVLVTGNMRDLKPLGAFQGIRILTPREFLTLFHH